MIHGETYDNFSDLTDVDVTGEVDEDIYTYNSGSGDMEPNDLSIAGWVYIDSATASNDAALTLDGVVSSAYEVYRVEFDRLLSVDDQVDMRVNLRDTGGTPADISGTYNAGGWYAGVNGTSSNQGQTSETTGFMVGGSNGNAAGEGACGVFQFFLNGAVAPKIGFTDALQSYYLTGVHSHVGYGMMLNESTDVGGFSISFETGNVSSGTMTVYGLTI
jgi:hypothetical protein